MENENMLQSGEHKVKKRIKKKGETLRSIKENYELYFFLLPTIVFIIIFKYLPMYGVLIAFKKFVPSKGILGSPWVGFEQFERFLNSYNFWGLINNTVSLSLTSLIIGFPIPIILALLLNQFRHPRYKKFIQTVIYAPNFISVVVLVGMIYVFCSPSSGLINNLFKAIGMEPIFFMAKPEWFQPLYVISGIWQGAGFGTIVYLAALSGISPDLYEAAEVDGANKFHKIWHIDLPGIAPTIIIMFILALGNVMNVGFEKAFLMQTSLNKSASSIIATYVYEVGLVNAQYSFSTAIGLFNAVINMALLVVANRLAKRYTSSSLF